MFKKFKMSAMAFIMLLGVLFGFIPTQSASANTAVSLNFYSTYYHAASAWRYYTTNEIIDLKVTRSGGNRDTRVLNFWIEDGSLNKIPGSNVYLQYKNSFTDAVHAPRNGYYRIHMACYKPGNYEWGKFNPGCTGTGWMDDRD